MPSAQETAFSLLGVDATVGIIGSTLAKLEVHLPNWTVLDGRMFGNRSSDADAAMYPPTHRDACDTLHCAMVASSVVIAGNVIVGNVTHRPTMLFL